MNKISLYEKIEPFKNNYPIKMLISNSRNGLHAHWHEHMELQFYPKGGYTLMCDNKVLEIKQNDLVVINKGQIHFSDVKVEGDYYCIIIGSEFFRDLEMGSVEIENLIRDDLTAKKYVEDIFFEFYNKNEGWDMAIKGILYSFVTYLFRNYKKVSVGAEHKTGKSNKKRMGEIIDYITTHYDEKLTTRNLAERFFVSEYYFCRYFRETMGQTPVEYINRYRIEKASVMLENKERPIGDIAVAVGFDDQNYFSRVFKKIMGMSPVEYRKNI